jgi:hypothetical protein
MRILLPLTILFLFLSGCGGHKISTGKAQKVIIEPPQITLEKEDVEVVDIIQPTNSSAVAETLIKAGFRLQKKDGKWKVREVQIGHGQWEKIENLLEALKRVKIEETHQMLDRIANAVREYHKATGTMPQFADYVKLSDILAPKYLDPLIRLDSWENPLQSKTLDSGDILVVSAGPDGRIDTDDDIRITIAP